MANNYYPTVVTIASILHNGHLLAPGEHFLTVTQEDYAANSEKLADAPGFMHITPKYIPTIPHHLVVLGVEIMSGHPGKGYQLEGSKYDPTPLLDAIMLRRIDVRGVTFIDSRYSAHVVRMLNGLIHGGSMRNLTLITDSHELQQELWEFLKFHRWDFIIIYDKFAGGR